MHNYQGVRSQRHPLPNPTQRGRYTDELLILLSDERLLVACYTRPAADFWLFSRAVGGVLVKFFLFFCLVFILYTLAFMSFVGRWRCVITRERWFLNELWFRDDGWMKLGLSKARDNEIQKCSHQLLGQNKSDYWQKENYIWQLKSFLKFKALSTHTHKLN